MNAEEPISPEAATAILREALITDGDRLRRYEIPERGEPGHASGLLVPSSEQELARLLRACGLSGRQLVISAGRTGLVEAQRPEGEVVLSLEKLNRPLEFRRDDGAAFDFDAAVPLDALGDQLADWWRRSGRPALAGATITVQAGLAVDALNALLQPLGLVWPMEMGSSSAATVGACVANASAGANAVCYGTGAHLCKAANGFWADGTPANDCAAPAWQAPATSILAIDSASVHPEWGLVGSQGVLGVITRTQLRTYALPAQREAALVPVEDMPSAMRILAAASEAFGSDVEEFEFIGRPALLLVQMHQGERFRSPLTRHDAPWYVLLQVKSSSAEMDLAGRLYSLLAETLGLPEDAIGYAPLKVLKDIRHSITESSNARTRALGAGRLSFDTATPVDVFGDYLDDLDREIAKRYPGIEFVAFGHAGVGGAHLHLLGTRERPVARHTAELVDLVFDVTGRFGGTFSAEHGVGTKWGAAFQRRAAPEVREALAAAKRLRDPGGILNPRSFGLAPPPR